MPAVISDFQVITDEPAKAPEAESAPEEPCQERALTPMDVARFLRRERERSARVRAH